MNYENYSDEKIIALSREGHPDAVDFLMERYKNLVRKKARTLYLIGGDSDDLIQEGMIGLYKAIRDFDSSKEVSFYCFAELCICGQLYNAIKASRRHKNSPLNTYVSLDAPLSTENVGEEPAPTLGDTLPSSPSSGPEEILIDKENVDMIEYELGKRLSPFESEVLSLYLSGMDYQQIAKLLDKSPKSIDNALQRIRSKLLSIVSAS